MDHIWIEKLAIQELCARYCQTIDAQDPEGWARCFTPDGAFEFDGHVVRGYDALRQYADAHTQSLRGRHMNAQSSLRRPRRSSDRVRDHGGLDRDPGRLQDHGSGRLRG
jgi:uncharacterized protein (TIGR02246 family)